MMLVVAVALSTATYAWFTTSTNVSAEAVVLTAATMDGEAILITHNANGTEASNQITLTSAGTSTLYPATPNTATAFTTFTSDSIANIGANFQNLLQDGTGKYTVPTLTGTDVSYYKDTFYVFNKGFQSTTLEATVKINYDPVDTTSAMAAKSARIAIIERVPSAEVAINSSIATNMSTYSLVGIWQFNGNLAEASYTALDNEATFSATTNYYTESAGVYTKANVTSSNFDELKSSLYTSDQKQNTAANGATGDYGATVSSDTYVNTQLTFTESGFSAIGAATSGNQIANEYTVVVWLEGWDADCTNQITSGVFSVELAFGTVARS